jgi:hypothetical protein
MIPPGRKQQLGELDFLFFRDTQWVHLETAIKFYLCTQPGGSTDPHQFIGPYLKDTLAHKLHKTFHHQLKLFDHCLKPLELLLEPSQSIQSYPLFKGVLYYPWESSQEDTKNPLIPPQIHPKHLKGVWFSETQLEVFLKMHSSFKLHYLPKESWLCQRITEHHPLPPSPLHEAIHCALTLTNSLSIQTRVFIVPANWLGLSRQIVNSDIKFIL